MSKICRMCWTRFVPERDMLADLWFCSGTCAANFLKRNEQAAAIAVTPMKKLPDDKDQMPLNIKVE